jgi:hypothetical protein
MYVEININFKLKLLFSLLFVLKKLINLVVGLQKKNSFMITCIFKMKLIKEFKLLNKRRKLLLLYFLRFFFKHNFIELTIVSLSS